MSKEFEKDDLLAKLAKTAGKKKAPALSEDILYQATRSDQKFGPRKWHTPKLLINLAGGAAVLAGIFALSANPPQNAIMEADLNPNLNQKIQGDALLVQGDISFNEEQLASPLAVSISDWGQRAIGNYVSNHPEAFDGQMWTGQTKPMWIFVVTDGVYFPNGAHQKLSDLFTLFSAEKMSQVSLGLTTDSNVPGIKLLIQGEDGVLHPLVVTNVQDGIFYNEVLDLLIGQTYTAVPLN